MRLLLSSKVIGYCIPATRGVQGGHKGASKSSGYKGGAHSAMECKRDARTVQGEHGSRKGWVMESQGNENMNFGFIFWGVTY